MKKILTASAYVLLAACTAYSHKAMEEQEQFVVETPYAETPAIDDTISPDVYARSPPAQPIGCWMKRPRFTSRIPAPRFT